MNSICIHGHFYQPPRENPWTGEIDLQESAAPYHDWNERITAECYAPNADPGPRGGDGSAGRFPSNYSRMSFDFGPTLLSWLERKAPLVYRAILEADRESCERFSGHGSAIAQAYNHIILPLANRRDKRTQVLWGIADFRHRFERFPEGMWLPETAVDLETLEILANASIRFTILAPHQGLRFRSAGEQSWRESGSEGIDVSRPYRVSLPDGGSIAVFFYDGAISKAVAFGELAAGGEHLAKRLLGVFPVAATDRLLSIATDGETYGHHYKGGERVLAEALDAIERETSARLAVYGEYFASHPPIAEAEIAENTSWSCSHGVGRWQEDCGCATGEHPDWNQRWRAPLRAALDWLRDRLAEGYEKRAGDLFTDPWAARDDAIELWLGENAGRTQRFLRRHARRVLTGEETNLALDLLGMQRHALLMYTSCGWFFDDVGGIEARQVLQYAGRAVQLAERALGEKLEEPFLRLLEAAGSNLAERGDARKIFEESVSRAQGAASRAASGAVTARTD